MATKTITVYWDTEWDPQNPDWVVSWWEGGNARGYRLGEIGSLCRRVQPCESDASLKALVSSLIREKVEDPSEWTIVVERGKHKDAEGRQS
jgi:hypothetical protein